MIPHPSCAFKNLGSERILRHAPWIPHKTWSTPHRGAKAGAEKKKHGNIQHVSYEKKKRPETKSIEKLGVFNRD